MILNLTQHAATPEQVKSGVLDAKDCYGTVFGQGVISSLLNFVSLPTKEELADRAEKLSQFAANATWLDDTCTEADCNGMPIMRGFSSAMIGGAPYLMAPLEAALKAKGIEPVYAFSVRDSHDQPQPDGSVRKVATFRHGGFIHV